MNFFTSVELVGNKILCRGYKNGVSYKDEIEFKPTIYMPSRSGQGEFKTIDGNPLEPLKFNSIKEANDFIKNFDDVYNFRYCGMTSWIYSFIAEYFKGEIKYDFNKLKIAYIDIETDSQDGYADLETADKEITAITIHINKKYYVFGCKPYAPAEENVHYILCNNEKEMLVKFVSLWAKIAPDIVSGWNIEFYDIPYIIRRLTRILGNDYVKKLSPWNIVKSRKITMFNEEQELFEIYGVVVLDYLPLFKKFSGKNPENYKLNTVAHLILKEKKLDYSEFRNLNDMYIKDYTKFINYNIRDVGLLLKLEAKIKLIELVFDMAINAKVNVIDVFKQTRMWDSVIYNYLLERNIIVPRKNAVQEKGEKIAGGFVKEPRPDIYKWVITLDLKSLYPSLIMHYNIGPETLVDMINIDFNDLVNGIVPKSVTEHLKENNRSLAANGAVFDKNKRSFIAEITEHFFNRRDHFKQLQLKEESLFEEHKKDSKRDRKTDEGFEARIASYNNYQTNYKIMCNALYGSLTQVGFRFYDKRLGEAITLSGQLTTQWATRKLNEYLNGMLGTKGFDYVIAADTDSVFLNLEKFVEKTKLTKTEDIINFVHKYCKEKLQKKLDEWFQELFELLNGYEQKLYMKRELICEKALFVAKKRYFCLVWDKEGTRYSEPVIVVKGIEAVRTSTPEYCRNKLKEAFKIIVMKDESSLHKFVDATHKEFLNLPIADISIPTGVQNLEKYQDKSSIYSKGTPMHVRAALLYNHHINKVALEKKIKVDLIVESDKMKYVILKVPNPIHENVVGFPYYLPEELGLEEYIDKEAQWNKAFIDPLKGVIDAIGWHTEEQTTIGDSDWV